MTEQALLNQLRHDTWIGLKPSPLHGIGVFAITKIPKGCKTVFSSGLGNWLRLPISSIEELPAHSRNLVETYCLYDDTHYFVPEYGFKLMDLVNYLNHSSTPNVESISDGEFFVPLRDIEEGEELLVNYGAIVDVDGYL